MPTVTISTFSVGQRVRGTVEQVLPYGVFVRLPGGVQGYIRRRELSASRDVSPEDIVSLGATIEAKVIALPEPGRAAELSHRAILPDPWLEFMRRYRKGEVVQGLVKDVRSYGAFVEILPGVDGLVPLEELATWEVTRAADALWSGDRVEAVITHVNPRMKLVKLSVRRRMQQLAEAVTIVERMGEISGAAPQTQPGGDGDDALLDAEQAAEAESALGPAEIEGVGRILVVEDNDEVRLPLVEWLCQLGFGADGVATTLQAIEQAQKREYGLLLVDLDLPDRDGLSLIRDLTTRGVQTRFAVMSVAEWLAERSTEIGELELCGVLLKPLDLDEIQELLVLVGRGMAQAQHWKPAGVVSNDRSARSHRGLLPDTESGHVPLEARLQRELWSLSERCAAETGFIFNMDPISQQVSILAQAGAPVINEEALYSLDESPVKDVTLEGQPVLEGKAMRKSKARFRKLLDLIPFESCIGVPVTVQGRTHHALFLFHLRPNRFAEEHLRDAQVTAGLVALALEGQMLEERIESINRIVLSGQLAAGFGHETYNRVSGLELQLVNLQQGCEDLACQEPGVAESVGFQAIRHALAEVLETALDLKNTAGLFQRLMRADEGQELDVNKVVCQAEAQLAPLARKLKASIQLRLEPELPALKGSTIRLLQIFLNVMLNALQHMDLKPGGRRLLEVTTNHVPGNRECPVQIRFSDTGPGIHHQLWENVFRLGFSTRPGGSGLGLYIARSLTRSMGGRISVEESLIPLGASFLLELPAAAVGEYQPRSA